MSNEHFLVISCPAQSHLRPNSIDKMSNEHFLVISCPAQSHLNPAFQLCRRLILAGATVTFATTVHGLNSIITLPSIPGLSFASFSDGFDDGSKPMHNVDIISKLNRFGSQTLSDLLLKLSSDGRPVTFLIYSVLLQWSAKVASRFGIRSAFFCIQNATVFAIYLRFFKNRSISIDLPGLPLLTCKDLPSFLLPDSPHASILPSIEENIETLEKNPDSCVLVNTFDALEIHSIQSVSNINLFAIGPLIPSNVSDSSLGSCDLFDCSHEYLQWLNSKPDCSVVYVSFGSLAVLQAKQIEEILFGLIESRRPFLFVLRKSENEELEDLMNSKLKNGVEGLIVPWCSQMEVLYHRSVACFVTHCGWNSTSESVVAGVPVVACPQFSDQTTNAMMVDEVWGIGVRAMVDEDGMVKRGEIVRCVDMVMGSGMRGEEIRRNSMKWKGLAMDALKEGGSLENNLRLFLNKIGK